MTADIRPIAIDTARIFVQIASYRDRECQWTIRDAFVKAKHPERVFVGVCWQFDPDTDLECFEFEPDPEHVRRIDFHARESRGAGWARLQAQSLWRGEEFTLQIDSHMRFIQNWDVVILRELDACPSQWPVLTIYPPAYWPPGHLDSDVDPLRAVQGIRGFTPAGMLEFTVHWAPAEVPIEAPKPTAAVAAGFVFAPSRMITDVPSDPYIYFEGDEPNLAVRLHTHGFDLFSPRGAILYHYYRRADSRRPWDDRSPAVPDAASRARLKKLVEPAPGDASELGRFGLGSVRSLADYELFAGVDFRARSVAAYARHYPFVHTDEVADALVQGMDLRPADGVALFLLDDEGFVFVPSRRAFLQLSREATFCWCALEEEMSFDALVAAFADRAGLEPSAVRRRVAALLCHWQSSGLISGNIRGDGDRTGAPVRIPLVPPKGATRIERTYRLLDGRLRVLCYAEADAEIIAPMVAHFGSLATERPGMPESTIEIVRVGEWRYVAHDGAYPAIAVQHSSCLAWAFKQALEAATRSAPGGLLQLHGVLISVESEVTLLIGDLTFVAGLAVALDAAPFGGMGGLAARCALVSPRLMASALVQINPGGMAQSVPQPMLIPDTVAEDLRASCPELDSLPRHSGFPWGSTVIPCFDRPAARAPRRVDRLVVIEAAARRQGGLEPIGPGAALRSVIGAATPEPGIRDTTHATALVDWIEQSSAWRLAVEDLPEALATLRQGPLAPTRAADQERSGANTTHGAWHS